MSVTVLYIGGHFFSGHTVDFWINPYSDLLVFQDTSKMLWSPYLVGISHFGDCMRNVNKSPKNLHSAVVRQVEVIWNPYLGNGHLGKLISLSSW